MADQDPDAASHPDAEDPVLVGEPEKRIAHYLQMLADENPASRWKAAESLGRLGDFRATGALIDALFDEDFRVRTKVAWALGSIGDPRALVPLQQLYRLEKNDQREIIEGAIAEIKRKMSGQ